MIAKLWDRAEDLGKWSVCMAIATVGAVAINTRFAARSSQ